MVQVLVRAAALVEQLGAAGPAGAALRDVAQRAGLPPATATRLLHELCALGWADQQGERGRYRLGPRLVALGGRRAYRGRLLAAADPVLAAFSRRHHARATLVVLRRGRRLVLCGHGGEAAGFAERSDLYASAGGRMLVAQLPWRARRRLVAAIGLPPRSQWGEATDWPGLNAACAEARRRGWILNDPPGLYTGIGLPVPDDEGGVAAIGLAVDKARWGPVILAAARRAAQRVARRMAS